MSAPDSSSLWLGRPVVEVCIANGVATCVVERGGEAAGGGIDGSGGARSDGGGGGGGGSDGAKVDFASAAVIEGGSGSGENDGGDGENDCGASDGDGARDGDEVADAGSGGGIEGERGFDDVAIAIGRGASGA